MPSPGGDARQRGPLRPARIGTPAFRETEARTSGFGRVQTTAPPVLSFSLAGFSKSSRLTPSHIATAAATKTEE